MTKHFGLLFWVTLHNLISSGKTEMRC